MKPVTTAQRNITVSKRSMEFVIEGSYKISTQKTLMMDSYEQEYRITENFSVSSRRLKRVVLIELP